MLNIVNINNSRRFIMLNVVNINNIKRFIMLNIVNIINIRCDGSNIFGRFVAYYCQIPVGSNGYLGKYIKFEEQIYDSEKKKILVGTIAILIEAGN